MGRPRKRRAGDTPASAGSPAGHPGDISLDTNFSFMEANDANSLEFLDLLSPSYALPLMDDEQYPTESYHHHHHYSSSSSMQHPSTAHFSFGADMLGRIDFADTDSADDEVSSHYSDSYSQYMAAHVPDTIPSLSPGPSMTPEPSPSPRPYHNTACRCLSSMYLAMDSLSRLPPSAMAAMKVARHACRVAHDVIHCQACSLPMLHDVSSPMPVQAFQNTMLLGALIPTVANAYARIMELVDAEATRAKHEGRSIYFTFREAGGLWGKLAEEEPSCGVVRSYDNRDLDADSWRLSVRALLRVDIYGYAFAKGGAGPMVHHLGLKDVIDALEERSRIRHGKIDEMMASGQFTPDMYRNLMPIPHQPSQTRQHNCAHIIEMARGALDRLAIA
jgi:hypothetical protein